MANSKIYGKPAGPVILFDKSTGALDVTSLVLGNTGGTTSNGTAVTATAAEINTLASSSVTNADLVKLHAITATAANINAVANAAVVSVTGAGALSAASHGGRVTVINSAAGIALTLPAATGTGLVLNLFIGTSVTSLTTTITCAGSDKISGSILQTKSDGTTKSYYANPASTTVITMDGSTKGGVKGDHIKLVDIASGLWALVGQQSATGTVASPLN